MGPARTLAYCCSDLKAEFLAPSALDDDVAPAPTLE
jgi:hypothetical protein